MRDTTIFLASLIMALCFFAVGWVLGRDYGIKEGWRQAREFFSGLTKIK